jgi:hypothetical protein
MNNYWDEEEEEEEGLLMSYLSSSLAATAADIGVDGDDDKESEGSNGMIAEEEDVEEEDNDDDIPRVAYAPDDPPTELPNPYNDLGRNLVDSLIIALRITELNNTIPSLETRAVAAEGEVRIKRARLNEALEAK